MRSSFDSRLLAIFFLLVLIIGCQQRPIEELPSGSPDNGPEKVEPKQVRVVSEPTHEQDSRENEITEQSKDTQSKEAPQLEGRGANSFYDPTQADKLQQELPPPPIDELLTPPVLPMNTPRESKEQLPKEESTNQEESTQKLQEIPVINDREEEQDTYTANNEQEKDTLPDVNTLPPPLMDTSNLPPFVDNKDLPPPFPYVENDIPQPWPTKNNPSKVAENEGAPKKDFPTIAKLNMELGIDISSIAISTLDKKGIPELKNEFEKIQQAYEAVKQASTAGDLTEDAKLRLNEEVFRLNKPRKMYYDVVKAQIKKQKEDLLRDVEGKLKVKQDELIKVKQDIEGGESATLGDLSKKISDAETELQQLKNQGPKFSQFKNKILEFNKAKQEAEVIIDEKEKALRLLTKQQDRITQKLNIQISTFEDLEKEIAKLKEEPRKIEESFTRPPAKWRNRYKK